MMSYESSIEKLFGARTYGMMATLLPYLPSLDH